MIIPHPFPLPPNAIQSDSERNLIGRRTEHDDFSCAFTERKRSCNTHLPNTYTGNASA